MEYFRDGKSLQLPLFLISLILYPFAKVSYFSFSYSWLKCPAKMRMKSQKTPDGKRRAYRPSSTARSLMTLSMVAVKRYPGNSLLWIGRFVIFSHSVHYNFWWVGMTAIV